MKPFMVKVLRKDGKGGFTKYFSSQWAMEKWVNTCQHGKSLIVIFYGRTY